MKIRLVITVTTARKIKAMILKRKYLEIWMISPFILVSISISFANPTKRITYFPSLYLSEFGIKLIRSSMFIQISVKMIAPLRSWVSEFFLYRSLIRKLLLSLIAVERRGMLIAEILLFGTSTTEPMK